MPAIPHTHEFYLAAFTAHQKQLDASLLAAEAKYPKGNWTRLAIEFAAENNMRKILAFEAIISQSPVTDVTPPAAPMGG